MKVLALRESAAKTNWIFSEYAKEQAREKSAPLVSNARAHYFSLG
jgi:hypothetical protein